jgi:hypothetical protein
MHNKSIGYMDTVLFLTFGNAVNVQLPDIGKTETYLSQKRLGKSAANFGNYCWSPG